MTYKDIPALLCTFMFAVLLAACVITGGPPTATELGKIHEQGKAIVLFRVVLEEPSGTRIKPFDSLMASDNLILGWGDFDTGGIPNKKIAPIRFLSSDSRDQGWIYLTLTPGMYYLAVQTSAAAWAGADLRSAPRWVIDIPTGASFVYAGSLHFPAIRRSLIGAPENVGFIDASRSQIRNQAAQAKSLAAEHLGDLGPFKTVLMERHKTDTFILRAPPHSQP